MIEKPSYSSSKRSITFSTAMAWVVIVILAAGAVSGEPQAVAFGTIALPSLCALIAALLGIHRVTGSMDMRTIADQQEEGDEP